MEYHLIPTSKIKKYIQSSKSSYQFSFLDAFYENTDIDLYYDYLKGLDPYLLNNLWNRIVKRWNRMRLELLDNEKFTNSIYYDNNEYIQIYETISYQDLNINLDNFISNNKCKCVFVLNIIIKYINPFLK